MNDRRVSIANDFIRIESDDTLLYHEKPFTGWIVDMFQLGGEVYCKEGVLCEETFHELKGFPDDCE